MLGVQNTKKSSIFETEQLTHTDQTKKHYEDVSKATSVLQLLAGSPAVF